MSLSLSHLVLGVPDMERSAAFHREVTGLREVERSADAILLTSNDARRELALQESDVACLYKVGFAADTNAELTTIAGRLERGGIAASWHEADDGGRCLAFDAPSGHGFEVEVPASRPEPHEYLTAGVRPLRLGHVTLNTDDVRGTERFLVEVLGLRVSDRMQTKMSWLRCGPEHHSVGLALNASGIHHVAFDVDGWDAFRRLGDHLKLHGIDFLWGPGRHTVGNSLFSYHLDPDGLIVETTAEMYRVASESLYQFGEWPEEPQTIVKWGPPPPKGFLDRGLGLRMPAAAA